jgi:hypothetical protein
MGRPFFLREDRFERARNIQQQAQSDKMSRLIVASFAGNEMRNSFSNSYFK